MEVSVQEAFGLWPEGEQSPADKPHLRHSSIAEWFKAEGLVGPLVNIADEAERERRIHEFGELKRFLFAKHLATLTPEERRQFEKGDHPSQTHSFADRAKPVAEEFRRELQQFGVVARVDLGWYHLDRIVLSVALAENPTAEEYEQLPQFFRGFEAKYIYIKDSTRT